METEKILVKPKDPGYHYGSPLNAVGGEKARCLILSGVAGDDRSTKYTENIAIGGSQTGQSNTTPSQVKELRSKRELLMGKPASVPAPGAALVFLTDDLTETEGAPSTTFATTTKTATTATVDASVLATSNGCSGNSPMGSSGKGSANDGVGLKAV
ncbi:hypothetical protein DFH05DRAFT_1464608 [Lentinula detonsa]|uniref:Uncharacterized protein n=1 Tax=Lentinula detonsa TaxID=2804962 RepID=A0A9W8NPL8_9AGAR|nr:hypothetical protein DFH05DRAFT_1464647 [Lentinula detonsa]KAJ3738485.1 hypothetical protein DFH05DRAFT_1464608 [Lentinula detonsa]